MSENINEILADVKKDGENPFDNIEVDTQPESLTENEPEGEKPDQGDNADHKLNEDSVEDKPKAFHEHPRWIERENELKALREQREQDAVDLQTLKEEVGRYRPKEDNDIPPWFKELYGENEVAWRAYDQHDHERKEQIKREIVEENQSRVRQSQEEAVKWEKWTEDQFRGLEAEGHKFNRNELAKFMLDYKVTDEQGNFDFVKGYELFEKINSKEIDPARSNARKQLADSTTKTTIGDKPQRDYKTAADLRGKPW